MVIHRRDFLEVYTLVHKYYMLSVEQVAENLLELTLPVKISMSLSAVCYLKGEFISTSNDTQRPAHHVQSSAHRTSITTLLIARSQSYSLTITADRGRFTMIVPVFKRDSQEDDSQVVKHTHMTGYGHTYGKPKCPKVSIYGIP